MNEVIVIMGVSGSGKTTVGQLLAQSIELPFYDADDFHPESNVAKMRAGVPLNDDDRRPWLEILSQEISNWSKGTGAILACSALKQTYRDILQKGYEGTKFIFLDADAELVKKRFEERKGHYMPDSLIQSQFDALEQPENAIRIPADQPIDEINKQIINELQTHNQKMTQDSNCDIGLIGLGVMGVSLARNLARNGQKVAVLNPPIAGEEHVTQQVIDEFPEAGFIPSFNYKNFVRSVSKPATILLMVKAGQPVDDIILELLPHLDQDSILIDGGNSLYKDTQRRVEMLALQNIHFVGMGVSGGEEGALKGPAMMPGGNNSVKEKILNQFSPIAAKAKSGEPCINWIGKDGAGHFVKMMHNGIEYAEMQLIAELYNILKKAYGMSNEEIADAFERIAANELESYLLSITVDILRHQENDAYTLDQILDVAGQKGTGKWSIEAGLEYGVAIPTIAAAVDSRILSSYNNKILHNSSLNSKSASFDSSALNILKNALYSAKVLSYDQGFRLIRVASEKNDWGINMKELVATWRGGCIIRSAMLEPMMKAFEEPGANDSLLTNNFFQTEVNSKMVGLKQVLELAMHYQIPTPALSSTLNYLLTLRASDLPINLIQAQRDYFGAHTYEKINEPRGTFYHTNWTQ